MAIKSLTKLVKAVIPTVQYGNVTIEVGATAQFEVKGTPQEQLKQVAMESAMLDKALRMAYMSEHKELAQEAEKLSSI